MLLEKQMVAVQILYFLDFAQKLLLNTQELIPKCIIRCAKPSTFFFFFIVVNIFFFIAFQKFFKSFLSLFERILKFFYDSFMPQSLLPSKAHHDDFSFKSSVLWVINNVG